MLIKIIVIIAAFIVFIKPLDIILATLLNGVFKIMFPIYKVIQRKQWNRELKKDQTKKR